MPVQEQRGQQEEEEEEHKSMPTTQEEKEEDRKARPQEEDDVEASLLEEANNAVAPNHQEARFPLLATPEEGEEEAGIAQSTQHDECKMPSSHEGGE